MESDGDHRHDSGEVFLKEAAGRELNEDALVKPTFVTDILREIFYSPMNLALLAIICFLVYKIVRDRTEVPSVGALKPTEPELPKMRRDFTVLELRHYDGNQLDGRVLMAVNGNVYDVSKGKRFYGPGGPYATFAGRDASRNLATFSVVSNDKEEYDDLSDLSAVEMDSVREWEMQFKEKYELVGKLLRRGEHPTIYDDEEEEDSIGISEESSNIMVAKHYTEQSCGVRSRQSTNKEVVTGTENETITIAEDKTSKKIIATDSPISLDTNSSSNIAQSALNSTDY